MEHWLEKAKLSCHFARTEPRKLATEAHVGPCLPSAKSVLFFFFYIGYFSGRKHIPWVELKVFEGLFCPNERKNQVKPIHFDNPCTLWQK